MTTQHPYRRAINANLLAVQAVLNKAIQDVYNRLQAAETGNQNGSVGAILDTPNLLTQGGTLLHAILILHRQS